MNMQATYSPEDNKLRLYSVSRLDEETYKRVKNAGFKWAPAQKLFVAPMWTPDRVDLLLELCDEIGDEDKSLSERSEERAERMEEYSEKRTQDADRARAAVSAVADNIPLGQPILVGHHSEKHARKDAERIENGMRKAVKMWETAEYWQHRAKAAIRAAKYKERPDVRARRIKGLETDQRRNEKNKKHSEAVLKVWSLPDLTLERALNLANAYDHGGCTLPSGQKYWSIWGALTDKKITLEEVKRQRCEQIPKYLAHLQRWIDHVNFRLGYERAMLAESGGTVTDKTRPEKGGACRCWASPHFGEGWAYIQKVNRVSVTILDRPSYGNKCYSVNMPLDKLHAVMSAAQVEEARKAGKLQETELKEGFFLMQSREEFDKKNPPKTEEKPIADKKASFEAMKETLAQGVKVVVAPQLFPTPPDLAARMVELAEIKAGQRILEPSAGTGAILDGLRPWIGIAEIEAIEINLPLCDQLRDRFRDGIAFQCCDFLEQNSNFGKFDRIIMNPPFENAIDIKHIKHAAGMLAPGGRLVALCANGPRQREALQPLAASWEDLPAGTFKASGTGVNVAMLVINAPAAPGPAPAAGGDNTRPEPERAQEPQPAPAPVPVAVVAPEVAAWLNPGKQLQAAGLMRIDAKADFKLENYEQKELF